MMPLQVGVTQSVGNMKHTVLQQGNTRRDKETKNGSFCFIDFMTNSNESNKSSLSRAMSSHNDNNNNIKYQQKPNKRGRNTRYKNDCFCFMHYCVTTTIFRSAVPKTHSNSFFKFVRSIKTADQENVVVMLVKLDICISCNVM